MNMVQRGRQSFVFNYIFSSYELNTFPAKLPHLIFHPLDDGWKLLKFAYFKTKHLNSFGPIVARNWVRIAVVSDVCQMVVHLQ